MESGIFCLEKNCRSTDCFKYKYKASFFVAEAAATFRVIKKAYNRFGLKSGLLMISFFYVV